MEEDSFGRFPRRGRGRASNGQTYPARTRLGFRDARRRAAFTQPGRVLPVRIDPADPARVAVDVPAFDARYGG